MLFTNATDSSVALAVVFLLLAPLLALPWVEFTNIIIYFVVLIPAGILRYIFHPALVTASSAVGVIDDEQVKNSDAINNVFFLSIVVPAYNEEDRLPVMLSATVKYLERNRVEISKIVTGNGLDPIKTSKSSSSAIFEIIVVDDGSSDNTRMVANEYAAKMVASGTCVVLRVVKLLRNSGKGAAVQAGMLRANGMFILMADADNATDINDLSTLLKTMMNQNVLEKKDLQIQKRSDLNGKGQKIKNLLPSVVIGSRAHLQNASEVERTRTRIILMYAFHFFVSVLCSQRVKDTQCGFKLFNREAALIIFSNLHLRRWAFDIEIITIVEQLNIPLAEVSVNWKEIDGSKLDTSRFALALNSIGMLRDMLCVRLCYLLRIWKIKV